MKKVKKFGGMRKHIIIVLCLVLFLLVNNSSLAEFDLVQDMSFDDYLKDHYEFVGKDLGGKTELEGYGLFQSISNAEVSGYGQITVTGLKGIDLSESPLTPNYPPAIERTNERTNICTELKIGIIGASNTDPNWGNIKKFSEVIQETCSDVQIFAKGGFSPSQQLTELFPQLIAQNVDVVIFS